jgi:hypothetical protein
VMVEIHVQLRGHCCRPKNNKLLYTWLRLSIDFFSIFVCLLGCDLERATSFTFQLVITSLHHILFFVICIIKTVLLNTWRPINLCHSCEGH